MKADYIHKDSLTLGEINGVQVAVSPEAYEEIKKQKIIEENKILKEQQQELERYKSIIDEFINKFEDFIETMEYEKIYHSDLKELLNELKELKELKGE